MHALGDVLGAVRLADAVFFTADLPSTWGFESPDPEHLSSTVLPDAECAVLCHTLMDGDCRVEYGSHLSAPLRPGDVIVVFQGAPRGGPQPATDAGLNAALAEHAPEALPRVSFASDSGSAHFICGYLNCDPRLEPLVSALPNILLLQSGAGLTTLQTDSERGWRVTDLPEATGAWLRATARFAIAEARDARPGTGEMLARLTELMLAEIVREYIQRRPIDPAGWLAGVSDTHVGRALRLLHADPTRNWTVDELAREIALSRSALAQRFRELVGEAPMHYLANWRMQVAKQMLREGGHTVQEIAGRVGYESEAAFNRAFKRTIGTPPATWRKRVARAG